MRKFTPEDLNSYFENNEREFHSLIPNVLTRDNLGTIWSYLQSEDLNPHMIGQRADFKLSEQSRALLLCALSSLLAKLPRTVLLHPGTEEMTEVKRNMYECRNKTYPS